MQEQLFKTTALLGIILWSLALPQKEKGNHNFKLSGKIGVVRKSVIRLVREFVTPTNVDLPTNVLLPTNVIYQYRQM